LTGCNLVLVTARGFVQTSKCSPELLLYFLYF